MKRHFLNYGTLEYHGDSFGCTSHCRKREIPQKHWRLSPSFGLSLGPPADFVVGITQVLSSITFVKRSVNLPPFLWSQRWGNYRSCKYSEGSKVPGRTRDVSANAASFWFLLWFLPVIPEVTEKRILFYPWQRASRAVQPFLLLLVEKNMSGEWGKAKVKTQDTVIHSDSSTSLFYKEPYQHSTI